MAAFQREEVEELSHTLFNAPYFDFPPLFIVPKSRENILCRRRRMALLECADVLVFVFVSLVGRRYPEQRLGLG